MSASCIFRIVGGLCVLVASVYVVMSGISEGRGAETVALTLLIAPVALLVVGMLSQVCSVPHALWKLFCRRVVLSGVRELEDRTQEV